MNLAAHDNRSIVTLDDGRQLEVENLQVNVDRAAGQLRRERRVDAKGEPIADWSEAGGASSPIQLRTDEIAQVELRSGRRRGGFWGAFTGVVVGGVIGAVSGFAIAEATANSCSLVATGVPNYPFACADNNHLNRDFAGAAIGAVIGSVLLGVIGYFVGRRGIHRTYVLETRPDMATEPLASPDAP